jgi:hypothetical protein
VVITLLRMKANQTITPDLCKSRILPRFRQADRQTQVIELTIFPQHSTGRGTLTDDLNPLGLF